jgi:hypothetical protein
LAISCFLNSLKEIHKTDFIWQLPFLSLTKWVIHKTRFLHDTVTFRVIRTPAIYTCFGILKCILLLNFQNEFAIRES